MRDFEAHHQTRRKDPRKSGLRIEQNAAQFIRSFHQRQACP
jgi:hypothetical protein